MCGINGIISFTKDFNTTFFEEKISVMNNEIIHRGPDSTGMISKEKVAFGFQRLSIIDLSAIANQPMTSIDGSIIIVFNGEIYNYIELFHDLSMKGHKFKTKSDTEVIINAYLEWGMECVHKFNGMWAFAIYDFRKQVFFASRDRLGVKPFYYHKNHNYFIFSSEVKAISKVESLTDANHSKAYEYISYGYNKTNDGETFIENVHELLPGTNLLISNNELKLNKYWKLEANSDLTYKNTDANNYFFNLFEDSLKLRFRSDVPIGLLLSGGIDSSAIAKITDNLIESGKINQTEIKAYTAHFPYFEMDEYQTALDFSKTLKNIKLKAVIPNLNDVVPNIENILYGLDQPVFSFNSIVHYFMLKDMSNDGIKVALNGQGADEAFYGYDRYLLGFFLWDKLIERNGDFFDQVKAIRKNTQYDLTYILGQLIKATLSKRYISYYRAKFQENIISCLDRDFIDCNYNHFSNNYKFSIKGKNLINYSIEHITNTGLNSILHYEDSSSMLNSIEMRSPFLDYRIIEFAFSIPDNLKYNLGLTKKIIRDTIGKDLPKNIVNNYNKIGFVTPQNNYMKSKIFNEFIKDTFNSKSFKEKKIWDSDKINKKFLDIEKNSNFPFWRILNYEIWCKMNKVTNI
jgi:asparagine synthase (glutamine-hydrolysing)